MIIYCKKFFHTLFMIIFCENFFLKNENLTIVQPPQFSFQQTFSKYFAKIKNINYEFHCGDFETNITLTVYFTESALCEPTPCQNGGTCRYVGGLQEYTCLCPTGYFGKHCHYGEFIFSYHAITLI